MSIPATTYFAGPVNLPIESLTMRQGAGVPGGQEYVTRRLLGDLVRGSSDPVLVRRVGELFEIIAGDVEYLAAKKRGASTVKALIGEVPDKEALLLRLLEGGKRGDLNPVEEAEIIQELRGEYGLTQQEIAMRCNRVQSTIANKTRLLRLPEEIRESLRSGDMGERHGRALLKIDDPEKKMQILRRAKRMRASAAEVEAMCDLASGAPKKPRERRKAGKGVIKDIRIYQNSLGAVVREMTKAGLVVSCDEESTDNAWEFNVQVRTEDS